MDPDTKNSSSCAKAQSKNTIRFFFTSFCDNSFELRTELEKKVDWMNQWTLETLLNKKVFQIRRGIILSNVSYRRPKKNPSINYYRSLR